MRVLLINIDSKRVPNLVLKKVELYHLGRKDKVIWDFPLARDSVDKIYVSCIYTWNHQKVLEWLAVDENIDLEVGGTGWDLETELPAEIENIKPHINLGFTTRGCIRKCPFCVVPRKEGNIRIVGDLLDLWDGKGKDVRILDNNILAVPEHFSLVCKQARDNNIRLEFDGLDARLLNAEIIQQLKSIKHKAYRFAFDQPKDLAAVDRAITILHKYGIKRSVWYVLVGYNTTLGQDLERLNYLRSRGECAFVQRFNYTRDPQYVPLARWANQHHIFRAMTFWEFVKKCAEMGLKRYINLLEEGICNKK